MLDRTDRFYARRRGTDLVRVQQTRAMSRRGRESQARKQLPAIYLSELGPGRVAARLKWFVSTIIVAAAGISIIGIVMYASMRMEDGSGMIGAIRHAGLEAMKPKAGATHAEDKPVSVGTKTARISVSSKGVATKHIIYEQVVQRRGTRDFITKKSYVRIQATLATDRPRDENRIPPFNAADLLGNDTPIARKDQSGGEVATDPRVTVRFLDMAGGFLPKEDNQELSNGEVEHLVAEADALYAESEASLTEAGNDDKPQDSNLQLASAKAEKNTTILYKKLDEEDAADAFDIRVITARGGEALDAIIKSAGVDNVQAGLVIDAVGKTMKSSKRLRSGEEVRLALTPSSLDEGSIEVAKLSLFFQGAHELTLSRSSEGGYVASDVPVKGETNTEDTSSDRASVYVSSYRAAQSQDLPPDFFTKFLKINSYDVDFKQKAKAGDSFDLFYELIPDENGGEKPGELLYVSISVGGETRGYYRFRTPDGAIDYYDDKGSNSKKFLMRMPVKAGRLTSGFGYRKHPLYGIVKLHSGIDYAAPVGTPILASGNGTIEVAGREGGYGNYVRIRHANSYKTAYGHMHRFAEGVVKGAKVRQGQIIGFIGTTGASTGPHLHYEVLVNNRFTNPLLIKIPRSRQLQARLLQDFRKEKARLDDLMHRPPVKTRVATIEK